MASSSRLVSSLQLLLPVLLFAYFVSGAPPVNETRAAAGGDVDEECKECPPGMKLIKKYSEGVLDRQYPAVVFAAYKSKPCTPFDQALMQGYFHLSMYSRGMNDQKQQLTMKVIVVQVDEVNDHDPRCSKQYTIQYYFGANVTSLPKSNNPAVRVVNIPSTRFYVNSFGGFVSNPNDNIYQLRQKLSALNLCYEKDRYLVAMFDSPASDLNRRNEAKAFMKPCPQPPTMKAATNATTTTAKPNKP